MKRDMNFRALVPGREAEKPSDPYIQRYLPKVNFSEGKPGNGRADAWERKQVLQSTSKKPSLSR